MNRMIRMNNYISIKDLEVFANHGVFEAEKQLGQKFLFSAEIYTDFCGAVRTDDISLSVDYGEVCKKIVEFNKNNSFRLIETAADKTAAMLLREFPLIQKIRIEIKKPWAPIGLPVQYVSVCTGKMWHKAFVAIGSNIGNREEYIDKAVKELDADESCQVVRVSDIIVTKPYGNTEQDDFLNGMIELRTYLEPLQLLEKLNEIENNSGRVRTVHWGPRTLDLDIILFDNVIIDSEKLTIPHYDMHNRRFVLQPLAQIAPYVRHPILKKTASELLREL